MIRSITIFSVIILLIIATPLSAEPAKTSLEIGAASQDLAGSMFKVIGGLFLVILAIFGSAWFYKRFATIQTVSNDALKVIGGIAVSQKDRVVLIQVGDEQLLVGVSPGRVQTLHVLNKPIEVVSSEHKVKADFSSQLSSAINSWKSR